MQNKKSNRLRISRRSWIRVIGGACTGALLSSSSQAESKPSTRFRFCLNTATIRGQRLPVEKEIEIAAQAGYDAIEPWMDRLHDYVRRGGSLRDLRKRIEESGLTVESAIGFPTWLVQDPQRRAAGLEQLKRDMDLLARIGGKRIAAPPAGVRAGDKIDIQIAAERYRQVLELGESFGVVPQLEMWARNPVIGRISTAIAIAMEAGHPKACFLGDLFHIYRSGCPFEGLRLLGPQALQVFHLNDYPPTPPRDRIRDSDRIMPGDGVGPIAKVLRIFRQIGAYPVLSLELFNRTYWRMDPYQVAQIGLKKMKQCVTQAFA